MVPDSRRLPKRLPTFSHSPLYYRRSDEGRAGLCQPSQHGSTHLESRRVSNSLDFVYRSALIAFLSIMTQDKINIGVLYTKYIASGVQNLESRGFSDMVACGRRLGMLANGGKCLTLHTFTI